MSKRDWERQRGFKSGHAADITAMAWSPNGALLISASKDEKVTVWETRSQKIVQRYFTLIFLTMASTNGI